VKSLIITVALITFCLSDGQAELSVDSLRKLIKVEKNDTIKLEWMMELAKAEWVFRISFWDSLIVRHSFLITNLFLN